MRILLQTYSKALIFAKQDFKSYYFTPMKKYILFLMITFLSISLSSQEINQEDAQGRKQGTWKKYYPSNDQLFYEGQFNDDIPYGIFTHYYETGELKSKTSYDGAKVHSQVYYPKRAIDGRGKFS